MLTTTTPNSLAAVAGAAAVVVGAFGWYNQKKTTNKQKKSLTITLPDWVMHDLETIYQKRMYSSDESMMKVAIELSAKNVSEATGGPFGAAVFRRNKIDGTATLVAVGVNRVVPQSNSTLHGETVAIMFAQQMLQTFCLSPPSSDISYELFTSCEPCAMCLGATMWSGVSRLVCGATKDDAEQIGFDEGPVYPESYLHLTNVAKIAVTKQVLRKEAAAVLQQYASQGQTVYAPTREEEESTAT